MMAWSVEEKATQETHPIHTHTLLTGVIEYVGYPTSSDRSLDITYTDLYTVRVNNTNTVATPIAASIETVVDDSDLPF